MSTSSEYKLAFEFIKSLYSRLPVAGDLITAFDKVEQEGKSDLILNLLINITDILEGKERQFYQESHKLVSVTNELLIEINKKVEELRIDRSFIDSVELKTLELAKSDLELVIPLFDIDSLKVNQFKYDTSENYAQYVSIDNFGFFLDNLGEFIHNPVLGHNVFDLMIEAQGHYRVFDDNPEVLLRALSKAESMITSLRGDFRIKAYELFGTFGLLIEEDYFYRRYLRELIEYGLHQNKDSFRLISWWNSHYYYNDKVALLEHNSVLKKKSYKRARIHASLYRSSLDQSCIQSTLEEYSIDGSGLFPLLDKVRF